MSSFLPKCPGKSWPLRGFGIFPESVYTRVSGKRSLLVKVSGCSANLEPLRPSAPFCQTLCLKGLGADHQLTQTLGHFILKQLFCRRENDHVRPLWAVSAKVSCTLAELAPTRQRNTQRCQWKVLYQEPPPHWTDLRSLFYRTLGQIIAPGPDSVAQISPCLGKVVLANRRF